MFKYGRNFPKRTRALEFKNILRAIPDHPISEDYLARLSGWKILGNNQYGDCAAVCWANSRMFITESLTGLAKYPTLEQVLELYKTQNPDFPNQDNGMDMQTELEYLNHYGGPDGVRALAFASVDTSNRNEVNAALAIFGDLWLGVEVQAENQRDFADGVPWDYHPGAQIEGMHAILAGGYGQNDVRFITWGAETSLTDSFWQHLVNCPSGEAFVVIWPENLSTTQFIQGIDLPALKADYEVLTNRPFPAADTTPEPTGCSAWLAQLFGWKP